MSLFEFYLPQDGYARDEDSYNLLSFWGYDYAFDDVFENLNRWEASQMMESLSLQHKSEGLSQLPSAPMVSQNHCLVCLESIANSSKLFSDSVCSHVLCKPCIAEHVQTELQKGKHAIKCPDIDCFELLNFEDCKVFLPDSTSQQWEIALAKACIPPEMIFYCPYDDCDGIFQKDDEDIMQTQCYNCNRLLCARCNTPWYAGYGCKEFQNKIKKKKVEENDTLLADLAKECGWKECHKCRAFVEKTWGCNHVTCRCGNEFCYACGEAWHSTRSSKCKPLENT